MRSLDIAATQFGKGGRGRNALSQLDLEQHRLRSQLYQQRLLAP